MAKLHYIYGTMNSSKTGNLIMTWHNYTSQNRKVLCLKPEIDTRWNDENMPNREGTIRSRAFGDAEDDIIRCTLVKENENLFDLVKAAHNSLQRTFYKGYSAVFVDEAQFLKPEQVKQLAQVANEMGISVYCYGLKNSYIDGKLFDGAAALLFYAQTIEEIKTVCKFCNSGATHNLRVVDGCAVYSGEGTTAIGDVVGEEYYAQVCYKHYIKPPAPIVIPDSKRENNDFSFKLEYTLNYNNEDNYYSKKKVPKGMKYEEGYCYFENKSAEIDKIKYFCIGNVMMDISAFYKRKTLTNIGLVSVVIKMLYDVFKYNTNEAFKILKTSQGKLKDIVFFETNEEFERDYRSKSGTSLKRYEMLPDGRQYYIDLKKKGCIDFMRTLMYTISSVCKEKVGVIYEVSEENNE